MDVPLVVWLAVIGGIVVALLTDLFVFHRDAHEVTMREAAISSAVWIAVGIAFGVGVWVVGGGERGGEWFAGYLIEKALAAADRVYALAQGRIVLEAQTSEPDLPHRLERAYFGQEVPSALHA